MKYGIRKYFSEKAYCCRPLDLLNSLKIPKKKCLAHLLPACHLCGSRNSAALGEGLLLPVLNVAAVATASVLSVVAAVTSGMKRGSSLYFFW